MNNDKARAIDIVFGTGIRQDLNPQTAPAGSLVSCDNLEFDQLARLVRRDGFAAINTGSLLGKTNGVQFPVRRFAQTPTGTRLFFTDNNTHAYFASQNKVAEAGLNNQQSTLRASLEDVTGIAADETGAIQFADCIAANGYVVYAYIYNDASTNFFTLFVDVVETASGAHVVSHYSLGVADVLQPRCVLSGGTNIVFIVWSTGAGNIKYSTIDLGGSTIAPTAAAGLLSDGDPIQTCFDVDTCASGWCLAYARTSGGVNTPRVIRWNSTPAPIATFDWTTATTGTWRPIALAICGDWLASSTRIHVVGYDAVSFKLECLTVLSALLTSPNKTHVDPGLSHTKPVTAMAITRIIGPAPSTTLFAFSNYTSATLATNPRGHLYYWTMADNAVSSQSTVFANYTLGSRFFRDARNGGMFAIARFDDPSGFQNHYLLLDFGTPGGVGVGAGGIGRCVPQLHFASGRVPLKSDGALTCVGGMADLGNGRFLLGTVVNLGTAQISGNQVAAYTFASLGTKRFLSTPCQGCSAVAGGTPLLFDGQRLVETSFYSYPVVAAGNFAPGNLGGFLSQGIYQYRLVYEWTDAQGNRHSSPASPAVSVDMSGGGFAGGTNFVGITVPAFHATRKQISATLTAGATVADTSCPVRVVVYRTQAGQTVFHRLALAVVNNTASAADDTFIGDSFSDAQIAGNEVLYSGDGGEGELDETAPPPTLLVTSHLERLCGIDGEYPERIWFTKTLQQARAPGYSPALQVLIPGAGKINGLGSQDGKLYALATNGIYLASYGDGPDNAGQGEFPSPQLITTSANCQDPRGVLVGQEGIFFVGKDQWGVGIYLIPRGDGNPLSIGKRVRNLLALYPVCRGVVNRTAKARTEFLFVDSDTAPTGGVVLNYHHDYVDESGIGQWTSTSIPVGGLIPECLGTWDDVSVLADSGNGAVGWQTPGTPRDFGSVTPTVEIETTDIRPAGLVGFLQFSGITLLGTVGTSEPLKIEASYDGGVNWPDSAIYGASADAAGLPVVRRYDTPTSKLLKPGSVRLRITDTTVGEALPGTTFFHGISLEVAPLGGTSRLSPAERN